MSLRDNNSELYNEILNQAKEFRHSWSYMKYTKGRYLSENELMDFVDFLMQNQHLVSGHTIEDCFFQWYNNACN